MPNYDRQFEKEAFFHIFNRGNHFQAVFIDDWDKAYFLRLIDSNAQKYGIQVVAYCLMRNHYHFAVRQMEEDSSVSKWIGCSVMSYVHYFNKKYSMVGSCFQCRYKSRRVLSDAYLLHLTRYIHRNPAEFCDPLKYPWSSIQTYLTGRSRIAEATYVLNMLAGQSYANFMHADVVNVRSDFVLDEKVGLEAVPGS